MNITGRILRRSYCSLKKTKAVPPVKKAVIVSTSHDIYTNLALENWIYKNQDLGNGNHILMLWTNDPCVVIGRHQNPWTESNVSKLKSLGVDLARRNSGGGTVYHDRGNLNLTFFTPKDHYNRRTNLEIIAGAIFKEFGLNVEISPREDLTIRDYKISGTAAKLARLCAYHHCTLLVEANFECLRKSLQPTNWEYKTNATKSIKSKVINLTDENPSITIKDLLKTIAIRYLKNNNLNINPNNLSMVAQVNQDFDMESDKFKVDRIDLDSEKCQLITPDEKTFPGITEMRRELMDWQWVFGKTPKFTVTKAFRVEAKVAPHQTFNAEVPKIIYMKSRSFVLQVNIVVEQGRVCDVVVQAPGDFSGKDVGKKLELVNSIRGVKYSEDLLEFLEETLQENLDNEFDIEKSVFNK